ncbi:MAG: sulfatase [Armatimonadota bacterium]|jgi:arylsulfatase A-like enzyme
MGRTRSSQSGASQLSRRELLRRGAAAGAALALGGRPTGAQERPPNLVFVFSDEQSWDMLGCYGNEQIVTPNLDRFAGEGVRFNHCVSSSPVCTPYRGALLTGQHPLWTGCLSNDIQLLTNNGRYLGHVLRDAGYMMGYVGKWHLYGGHRRRPVPAGPHRHGFDDVFLTNNCHVDYRPGKCFYWNEENEQVFFDEWEVYGQTRQALQFLDDCTDEQPFCLFVSWHPPHDWGKYPDGVWRYDTIPELMSLYDPDKIRFRENFDSKIHDKRSYHGHMAMCSGVDVAFGWLMEKLREKGFDRNTLVVFTSDHGDQLGSHGRTMPKGAPEDEACRVPLLMRWPERLPAGKVSDLLVGTLDLMPTLLGLLGLPIPRTCQGEGLHDHILAGRGDAVDSVPLFLFPGNWRGVYTHDYTYATDCLASPRPQFRVLFDKRRDPRQMNNLFGEPEYRAVENELHGIMLRSLERFRDSFVDFRTLMRICFADGKPPNIRGPDSTGVLLGRPIDIIRARGM